MLPRSASDVLAPSRYRVLAVIVFGVLLYVPSLWWGFFADDYGHQIILQGIGEHPTMRAWSLYDFGGLPPKESAAWQSGGFPWWTDSDWRVSFFRPLTSVSLWVDHLIYDDWAVGFHLTGLLLFGLLLYVLYGLYLELGLSGRAALLALWLFAAADSSLFPVSWPANRNTLLSALFGVLAVSLFLSSKRRAACTTVIAALFCAFLSCLCKESGVVYFGVIAALGWVPTDSREGDRRPKAWTPATILCLLVVIAYPIVLAATGFGTRCDFYAPPWSSPVIFGERLLLMFSAGCLSLLVWFPIDGVTVIPSLFWPMVLIGGCGTAWLGRLVLRTAKAHSSVPFLLIWIVLTLFPQAIAPPQERLLFVPSMAGAAMIALFIRGALDRDRAADSPRRRRLVAKIVFVFAALIAPLQALGLGVFMCDLSTHIREVVITADVGPISAGRREAFILNAPTSLIAFNALSTWAVETGDANVRFWPMQVGRRGVRWTRIDDRTFDLESLDTPFLTSMFARVYRSTAEPARPGDHFTTPLFDVTIQDVDETGLRRFRVRCLESIDSAHYRFLSFRDGRLKHTPPPAIGESLEIEAVEPWSRLLP
ncbi:MAG: hypothetical protein IH987_14955 [Planctomycetes bacterium]|nr:hypothetical protein [Planctomycetota bacterium]